MTRILCLLFALAAMLSVCAQRTTRGPLKLAPTLVAKTIACADTVIPNDTVIVITGYEKTLRAHTESMLVTNNDTVEINGLNITIDYFDTSDRQLHQRTVPVRCQVPPGETRMASVPSWDKQCVWYYYRSETPRTHFQATPYKVKIKINYYTTAGK